MRLIQRGDSVRQSLRENRPLKLVLTGVMVIAFIGFIQMFVPGLLSGFVAIPTLMITIFVAIALIVSILFSNPAKDATEKRKRGLDGADMYTMIDRLVEDLDEDELAYLRRRLQQHEPGKDRELNHALETLLDERSVERQTRQE